MRMAVAAAQAEADDMKGIMADTARILSQKSAEVLLLSSSQQAFYNRACLASHPRISSALRRFPSPPAPPTSLQSH